MEKVNFKKTKTYEPLIKFPFFSNLVFGKEVLPLLKTTLISKEKSLKVQKPFYYKENSIRNKMIFSKKTRLILRALRLSEFQTRDFKFEKTNPFLNKQIISNFLKFQIQKSLEIKWTFFNLACSTVKPGFSSKFEKSPFGRLRSFQTPRGFLFKVQNKSGHETPQIKSKPFYFPVSQNLFWFHNHKRFLKGKSPGKKGSFQHFSETLFFSDRSL